MSDKALQSGTFRSFANPKYRRLWMVYVCVNMARKMQYPLLFWFVLEVTDSPFQVALVGFFAGLAGLFAGCFSGFLADKFNRLVVSRSTIFMDFLASSSLTTFL